MKKHFLAWAALLLALALPARAQQSLTVFTPVDGRLNSGGAESWTFSAAEGSLMSFLVEAVSSGLDPRLTITSSAGAAIIANDDYNYPDSPDALLEAITLPRTDTYTATVSAAGGTSGDYRLTMLAGYGQISRSENFNSESGWQSLRGPVRIAFEDGALALALTRAQETGIATNPEADIPATYYAQVDVNVTEGQDTWTVGMTARQTGADTYYLLAINERGESRFVVSQQGSERILRDWTPHPAIVAGNQTFTLALLISGSSYDFFYNSRPIGRLNDTTLPEGGTIGLALQTGAVRSTQLAARFDNLTITTPLLVNGQTVLPTQLMVGAPAAMAQELQRRGVAPPGGEMVLNVGESFVGSARPGIDRFMLGRGVTYRTFALGSTFSWQADGPGITGCGLVFHAADDRRYTLAYADRSGGYGLSRREDDSFAPGIFGENPPVDKASYHLLVVALEDRVHYYVDGLYSGTLDLPAAEGAVGNAVVNFEPVNTSCRFRDTWVWRWN